MGPNDCNLAEMGSKESIRAQMNLNNHKWPQQK